MQVAIMAWAILGARIGKLVMRLSLEALVASHPFSSLLHLPVRVLGRHRDLIADTSSQMVAQNPSPSQLERLLIPPRTSPELSRTSSGGF